MGKVKHNTTGTIQIGRGNTSNAELSRMAEDFFADLAARKAAASTIRKRRDDLRKFLLYLERVGIKRFQDVDLKLLEAYRLCLVEHKFSPNTIESDIRAVQIFFRFLEEKNILFDNPAYRLKVPKAPVILGQVLTENEIQKLLSVPDITKPRGLRDRALLEMLYSTGMRRGEAAELTIYDVDLERSTVRVKGKFSKQRILPLGKHAVKFLRLYITEARNKFLPKFKASPDQLWLNYNRASMCIQGIGQVIMKCARKAGLELGAHSLRRSCATHMLRGGAHPVVVAQMLGHCGLRSLSHYLQTNITDLMKAHEQSNPGK